MAMNDLQGLPPVELYKLGEVYFVRDGNHRVSVARANGASHIEAYVIEVKTDVPITAHDFEHDEWILKAERADFMEQTQLDKLRPDDDFYFTEPGRYRILLRHIEVHRYFQNLEYERAEVDEKMEWDEAVASWYDNVYLPVVEAIRHYGLLKTFPNRTEADLYLWITHHREQLAATYGLAPLSPHAAVATFAETHDGNPLQPHDEKFAHRLASTFGRNQLQPLGMSEDEFNEFRARRAAGEISLGEAEEEAAAHDGEQKSQRREIAEPSIPE